MSCSLCGESGHNARTCPHAFAIEAANDAVAEGDYAVWLHYSGMSKDQAKAFRRQVEDLLDEMAPDAYGVSACGKESELPDRIGRALNALNGVDQPRLDASS